MENFFYFQIFKKWDETIIRDNQEKDFVSSYKVLKNEKTSWEIYKISGNCFIILWKYKM